MPADRATHELAPRLELERALRLLRSGKDPARILEELSRRLTSKLLHAPTKAVRESAALRKSR